MKWYTIIVLSLCALVGGCANNMSEYQDATSNGFVRLQDIDPTIIQSVRYAQGENFMGRPVDGYNAPIILLTRPAAEALAKVQADLAHHGYSLVVYDGYRPQQAVEAFWSWSQDQDDEVAKPWYYPTISKSEAIERGYIGRKSAHSRGSTVDLTIIELGKNVHRVMVSHRPLANGDIIPFLDDGTVDMGSSFDLLHEASHHDSPLVDSTDTAKRNVLREIMKRHGFIEYSKEWWHYTLENEPYPDTYFNFVID